MLDIYLALKVRKMKVVIKIKLHEMNNIEINYI